MSSEIDAMIPERVGGPISPSRMLYWYGVVFLVAGAFVFLEPAMRPLAQLLMVLPLSILLWRTPIQGIRVPRGIFVVTFFAVIFGAILRFSTVHLRDGAFVVATVSKRELWQETKIYRDRLHRALGPNERSLAGLHRGIIDSRGAAESVLNERPALGGVIWGAPRWMTISFRRIAGLSLTSFDDKSFAREWLNRNNWKDLYVVRSVPSVGISHGHQDATVHFIAREIHLWSEFERKASPGREDSDFEVELAALARSKARWSSRTHIGHVLWMQGTYHLIRAIEGAGLHYGDLACALREFEEALGQFRKSDNLELYAAIQNNFALAMLVEADSSEKRDEIRYHALKRMKVAQRLAISKAPNKEIVINAKTLEVSQGRKHRDARK